MDRSKPAQCLDHPEESSTSTSDESNTLRPPLPRDELYVSDPLSHSASNNPPPTRPRLYCESGASAPFQATMANLSTAEQTLLHEMHARETELVKRTARIEELLDSFAVMFGQPKEVFPASTPISEGARQPPTFTPASGVHAPQLSHSLPYSYGATLTSGVAFSNSAIREALELVPQFNGHNIPVLQFARACKRAKELLPITNETHLVRVLRNKLVGHAYLAVEDKVTVTVDQLVDCLKRTFGPARNPNYYRGQLSVNFMKDNEHILDYIGRVKDLRCAIIEADQSIYNRSLTSGELSYIDSFTLDSFYDGLPPEYRTELRNDDYQNLEEAYDKAILAAKRLDRDRARRRGQRSAISTPATPPPPRQSDLTRDAQPPVAILTRAPTPLPSRAPRTHPFSVKICAYCKKMGHLISECRKRQFNNAQKEQPNRQGNACVASVHEESRGLQKSYAPLPLEENPRSSTSSDPQPGTSRQ